MSPKSACPGSQVRMTSIDHMGKKIGDLSAILISSDFHLGKKKIFFLYIFYWHTGISCQCEYEAWENKGAHFKKNFPGGDRSHWKNGRAIANNERAIGDLSPIDGGLLP